MTNTKAVTIARDEKEIFEPGKFRMWKKGEISNPSWLKRDSGSDFITVKSAADVQNVAKYLSGEDQRLACEYYNCYSTQHDKSGNRMIVLYDQNEAGDNKKIAIIVMNVPDQLSMLMVEFIEEFCQ